MKSKFLFSLLVVASLFIQKAAAQDVGKVLQSKEKRQMVYSSIINNDDKFLEFLEATIAAGRANEGITALNEGNAEENPAIAGIHESYENQQMMDQMVRLMKEFAAKDPEFQKAINERYPDIGKAMRKDNQKL